MRKNKKRQTVFFALAMISILFAFGCTQGSADAPAASAPTAQAAPAQAPTQGSDSQALQLKAAPSFSVETIEGRTVSTESYKTEKKPMVLYFMASTCSTCAKNWKNINEVYPEYKGKVDLVAVSVDPTDDVELLKKLAAEKGFTFETVAGNPGLAVQYDVKKQTAKFAIDKDGNIVSRHDGLLTPEEWKDLFESVA